MESVENKITGIKTGKGRNIRRSSIFLNGKYSFSLDNEVITRELLKVGLKLTDERIAELIKSDGMQKCLNSALTFLSYRPRSESEIKSRLFQNKYTEEEIENTLIRLRKLRLIDDSEFADYWKDNRNEFRPQSKLMLKRELRLKGVDSQVIEETLGDISDEENAYKAALKKAGIIKTDDYKVFYQKLGSYLQRRGFDFSVINKTVKRIWEERQDY